MKTFFIEFIIYFLTQKDNMMTIFFWKRHFQHRLFLQIHFLLWPLKLKFYFLYKDDKVKSPLFLKERLLGSSYYAYIPTSQKITRLKQLTALLNSNNYNNNQEQSCGALNYASSFVWKRLRASRARKLGGRNILLGEENGVLTRFQTRCNLSTLSARGENLSGKNRSLLVAFPLP